MESMTEAMEGIRLTAMEGQVIECMAEELDLIDSKGKPALIRKLHTMKAYTKEALLGFLKSEWETSGWVRFNEVTGDVFLITFEKEEDKSYVFNSGPWIFSKSIVLLNEIVTPMKVHEIVFSEVPLWTQVFGLPKLGYNEAIGRKVGERMGRVLSIDCAKKRVWRGALKGQDLCGLK